MLKDFNDEIPYPRYNIFAIFQYNDFDIYLCYPLPIALNMTYGTNDFRQIDYAKVREDTKKLLQNYTLEKLNSKSLLPQDVIKAIYYSYKPDKNRIIIEKPLNFIFLNSNYSKTKIEIYSRCWGYRVPKLAEPNYRTLLQGNIIIQNNLDRIIFFFKASRLIIESEIGFFNIFLADVNKSLTPFSNQIDLDQNIEKDNYDNNPEDVDCEFYENSKFNCNSYESCLNMCLIEEFINKNNKLPPHLVIDNRTYLKYRHLEYDLEHSDQLSKIGQVCRKKFFKPDCKSIVYRPGNYLRSDPLENFLIINCY